MTAASESIAHNLARVRERIELAASRVGRNPGDITIVAVSKTQPAEKILELYEAGVRQFGENKIQEREAKGPRVVGLDITWHMIGHLQKNKAARSAALFQTVDSVDSIALAEKLDQHSPENRLRALIEVKLDPEPAKSGVPSEELARVVEGILPLPRLNVCGLMGIPPYFDDPEEVRPYFRHLRELRDALASQFGLKSFPTLSMGMSHDFEIAIEEGATEVRIGTALFGERPKP